MLDEAEKAFADDRSRAADILSLRARLWKDAFQRAPDRADAMRDAMRARDEYLKAYALAHDPYPGINAATLACLLGDRGAARRIAAEVLATLARAAASRSVWDLATDGEARLLLGDIEGASRSYVAAQALASGSAGTVATMRRQVALLARAIPEANDVLRLLRAPDVVAFAGHMVDAPDRAVPRFPASLVPAAHAALRDHVAHLHQPIVFTSAACGADLLFIDAALERGAEVNVVLPFDRRDFIRTSVAVGGDEWLRRFDDALARATRVIMATEENHLGDDILFEHAAKLAEGFAMLRAAQLETAPSLLCLIDASLGGRVGGTLTSYARWQRNVGAPQVIDLSALRNQPSTDAGASAALGGDPPTRPGASDDAAAVPGANGTLMPGTASAAPVPQRTLKTLLFADFSGFSRVQDAFAPQFHERFLQIGAAQIAASPVKPLDAKTWGDGLYVVFESPSDGAEFALRFLERTLEVDWTAAGLSATNRIRIALHAGPVFRGFDPVMGRNDYFGSSVTRAARIEPVTLPGTVYASEAYAATLAASGQRDYALEYIGRLPLAKGYGESRIYRLDRR